jgi:hypothetical protein
MFGKNLNKSLCVFFDFLESSGKTKNIVLPFYLPSAHCAPALELAERGGQSNCAKL